MKDIIIFSIVGAIMTTLILALVVIPSPKEFTSYLALSFALVVDAFPLSLIILTFKRFKVKPKTISLYWVFWLSIVLYCCLMAVGLLTNGYIKAEQSDAKAIVLAFDCIFAAFGLAAFVVLTYQIITYIIMKRCLKYGKEATAEFVSDGKGIAFGGGRVGGNTVFRMSVKFSYVAEGQKKTAESRRVYSKEEVNTLRSMGTFNIKYTERTAVINEIFKNDNAEQPENKNE